MRKDNYIVYIGVTAVFGLFGLIYAPRFNSERIQTEHQLRSILYDREKTYKKYYHTLITAPTHRTVITIQNIDSNLIKHTALLSLPNQDKIRTK